MSVLFFSMSMKVLRFCHRLWHVGKQLWGTEEEISITQKGLSEQAGTFQTAAETREDVWPQSTHNFLCDKSSVKMGVKGFCRISCTALQYKCLSFTDVPSNAGALNESSLVDKLGSIKNRVFYLHNKTLSGTFLNP